MNKLKGQIVNIQSEENISLVDINVGNQIFRALVLETQETSPFLRVGNFVYILFKETEVSIGKIIKGSISLSNRIPCTVWKIKKGKILSQLELIFEDIKIFSIITTSSLERLGIKEGDSVEAFIKANEVSIMEMLNE
jgi:molybdopterin-binding protein